MGNLLREIKENFTYYRKKRWIKRAAGVMAVFVLFFTAYSLILPAIALNPRRAEDRAWSLAVIC